MQRSLAHLWAAVVASVTLLRSRSSDNHTYKHAYLCVWCVCVCVYIYTYIFLFAFLSIPDSCLPNSLFLLDTGNFLCTTTSCRPCQPTFLPGFHCLGWVCVFLVAVYTVLYFTSIRTHGRTCADHAKALWWRIFPHNINPRTSIKM